MYYGKKAKIMASQCEATHLIDYNLETTILDAVEQLLLSNLSTPLALVCEPDT